MYRTNNEEVIEGARIIFRNFEGKEGKYNRAGDRNFALLLEEDKAREMERDGWNVKRLKPREDETIGQPYITVSISFKGRAPRIVMITQKTKRRTILDEETCDVIDWADIAYVDVTIRQYNWEVNGSRGTKAYLKTIFVIIEEDYLELKYSDAEWNPEAIETLRPAIEQYDIIEGEIDEDFDDDDTPLAIEGRK